MSILDFARTRSRISSWAESGTHTHVSSPARCNLVRLIAFRQSVLIRSPGLRGINEGATDHDAFVSDSAQLTLNAITTRPNFLAKSLLGSIAHQLYRQRL
jgi:hypothetical protein